jgi:hypothetical protein
MALEVRYIPMKDEGQNNYPKIMRVIYKDNVAVSYAASSFSEAKAAAPESIEAYFDLVKEYFAGISSFCDSQTDFSGAMTLKMEEVMYFCIKYIDESPLPPETFDFNV